MPYDEIYQNVLDDFAKTRSVKQTAKNVGTTLVRAQRILITEGLWSSKTSENVGELYAEHYTVPEIAKKLFITEKTVQAYLPYRRNEKGYGGEKRSNDAKKSNDYRKRQQQAYSNQVLNKDTFEELKMESAMLSERKPILLPVEEYNLVTREKLIKLQMELDEKNRNNKVFGNMTASKYYDIHKDRHFKVLRLSLELKMKHLSDEELGNLKLYGKVLEGINREILVPGDITLHALHYVIQRAFGWQNSHLHNFKLPEDAFQKLTGGKNTADKYGVYNYDGKFTDWVNMCGVYFRYPTENYDDIYWDDDYVEGHSFKSWLRRKYVGPYNYDGEWEHYQKANSAARYMMKRYPMIDVSSYIHTSQMNINKLETIDKSKTTIPIAEATIEDVQYGFMYRLDELLERIPVANILTPQGVDIDDEIYSRVVDLCNKQKKSFEELPVFPVTDELIYTYDYGDCWEVSIKMTEFYYTKDSWTMMEDTKQDGYFIPPVKENNVIDDQLVYNLKEEYLGKELSREIAIVAIKKKPVCVALDGLSVMDDVGGVHGYIDFLKESRLGDAVQKEELKAWARFMGWTGKMSKPDKLL